MSDELINLMANMQEEETLAMVNVRNRFHGNR